MSSNRWFLHGSIQTRVNAALVLILAVVMITTISYSSWSGRQLVSTTVEQRVLQAADAYFDNINTMMLTGTLAQRELLRQKILDRPGFVEARIIRSPELVSVYGPGLPEQKPVDQLDQRALTGEPIRQLQIGADGHRRTGEPIRQLQIGADGHRRLTVLQPLPAVADYGGINCLTCHPVTAGTILGAVRLSYDLSTLDQQVDSNVLEMIGVQLLLYLLGMVAMVLLVRHIISRRLLRLQQTMEGIAEHADLSTLASGAEQQDEIGGMAVTFNRMLASFRASLSRVNTAVTQLVDVANRVAAVADETHGAVLEQRRQTESVATAVNQMSATVREVASHAAGAMSASGEASDEVSLSHQTNAEARALIEQLAEEVDRVAQRIKRLDNQSEEVSSVLEVIHGVAEQTNLLALNAAIEAARAGEQGRGFSVVADEVRTLASRTQQSTKEIRVSIERLQGEARNAVRVMSSACEMAHDGANAVGRSVGRLVAITDEVQTINDMNTQIATAAEQQSAVAVEIDRNISNIRAVADSTADGAAQSHQVSLELQQLATRLQQILAPFRL